MAIELKGKEKGPIKQKDVNVLFYLTSKHPGDLTENEKVTIQKLELRRSLYGQI